MIKIKGEYNEAVVFVDSLENSSKGQIETLCNQEFARGSKIRIMPDVHAGKGCTIGTTMTIDEFVVPNLVGVDIGCGMLTVELTDKRIELQKLDKFIIENIPAGREVRSQRHRSHGRIDIEELRCFKSINSSRARESLGTLGGGNHFIEVDKDDDGKLYLVIHTGSRNLGLTVAQYYQNKAYEQAGGRGQSEIAYELAPLSGELMQDYLHDIEVMQRYASLNRQIIKEVIMGGLKLRETDSFETIHNYIDTENMILRKGAVSAKKGERLLIPINMRDGSLICTGLGNEDYNQSAPHGAGRLFSRTEAENSFTLSEFKKQMNGIYTTSVNKDTLDECPMAYKPIEFILENIKDTVTVEKVIRPIYNFKASERADKRKGRRHK